MSHESLSPQKPLNPMSKVNDMASRNVYAEVRGKYARLPVANEPQKQLGVVSRPTTSGSYVKYSRKSQNRASSLPPQDEVEVEVKRPLAQEEPARLKRNLVSRGSLSSRSSRKSVTVPAPIGSTHVNEAIEEINEDLQEENLENEEKMDNGDAETEYSFKTTSSQRKYIEELEQMLRAERLKRLQAEEQLKKLKN